MKLKAAIAIDAWKLPIFERRLKQAGYTFTNRGGLTADTLVLTVDTENMGALAAVVYAANNEAARSPRPA